MQLEEIISLVNAGANTAFMLLGVLILLNFINKFEGDVQYTRPNIGGLVLMALGLIFHIFGNLLAQFLTGTTLYETGLKHAVASFISLSVVMFIIGTSMIWYHISSEELKPKVKFFGWFFFVFGMIDVFYHFIFFFTSEDITVRGRSLNNIEAFYLMFEMAVLIGIYILLYIQSRRSVSKVVSARYQLISITALGYVLVILVDLLIKLQIFTFGSFVSFALFFVLHVITVGALYLLVLFPEWYQEKIGVNQIV